jgi:DNA polymerase
MLVAVYDIKNCGPRHRFVANGKLVHNSDSVNLQNLPSRGSQAGKIKKAIKAPPGYIMIDCDSSQIEARTLAWLAGQQDLLDAFENKQDVYRIMASHIYGVAPDQITSAQRFIGKTTVLGCIAEGELVLTDVGLVPIEKVTTSMRVWDGIEWVSHEGPIYQGEQEVLIYDSLTATPDHIVYLQDGSTCRFDVAAEKSLSIAHTGDGGVPLRHGGNNLDRSSSVRSEEPRAHPSEMHDLHDREMVEPNERSTGFDERLPKMQPTENATGLVGQTSYRHETALHKPEPYELEALRGQRDRVSLFVGERSGPLDNAELGPTQRTGVGSDKHERALRTGEFSVGHRQGEQVTYKSNETCDSLSRVQGTTPRSALRRLHTATANLQNDRRGDSGEVERPIMQAKRRVWDLLNAGPRHRFTVSGRLVSNCGYGVGHNKLKLFLKTGAGVEVDEAEAKRIVETYRRTYARIPELWKKADTSLAMLAAQMPFAVDVHGIVQVVPGVGLTLPSGLHIQYPNLRQEVKDGNARWVYDSRGLTVDVYGGKCVENFTQAIARCIVAEQMLRISRRYKVVLTVHDAVACVAPEAEREEAVRYVEECMSWRPIWAPTLPLACESGWGASYGDC